LIVKEGTEATTRMLLGILGCNVAWGLIDGAMYLMSSMLDRSRKARLLQSVRKPPAKRTPWPWSGGNWTPGWNRSHRSRRERACIGSPDRLVKVTPEQTVVKKEDVVERLSFSGWCSFPPSRRWCPFWCSAIVSWPLRVSNLLLLTMLFLVGYRWARVTHSNPWIVARFLLLADGHGRHRHALGDDKNRRRLRPSAQSYNVLSLLMAVLYGLCSQPD